MKIKADTTGLDLEITDSDKEFASKISKHNLFGMLGDQIASWRFQNAVRVFRKTEQFAKENNVSVNLVPSKFLQQFIDGSSLEEDINMQDMWANLLLSKSQDENAVNILYVNILKSLEPLEATFLDGAFRGSNGDTRTTFNIQQVASEMNIEINTLRIIVYKMYSFNILRPPFFSGIAMWNTNNNPAVETPDMFRFSELGLDFCNKCGVGKP